LLLALAFALALTLPLALSQALGFFLAQALALADFASTYSLHMCPGLCARVRFVGGRKHGKCSGDDGADHDQDESTC
jgi:hypothetical protein